MRGVGLNLLALKLETERQYQGIFRVDKNSEDTKKFEEWVVHLPRVLWELGSSNLSTTEVILRFLLRLFQRKSCLVHEEVRSDFQTIFTPLLVIDGSFSLCTDYRGCPFTPGTFLQYITPYTGTTARAIR